MGNALGWDPSPPCTAVGELVIAHPESANTVKATANVGIRMPALLCSADSDQPQRQPSLR
jgi:hypothetical protein